MSLAADHHLRMKELTTLSTRLRPTSCASRRRSASTRGTWNSLGRNKQTKIPHVRLPFNLR